MRTDLNNIINITLFENKLIEDEVVNCRKEERSFISFYVFANQSKIVNIALKLILVLNILNKHCAYALKINLKN